MSQTESGMMSVDKWSPGSQAYFLTHLHADHTVGLSSSWRCGPLFCSRLTAKLFACKFPEFDLSLLCIVDIGSWHTLSMIDPSSGSTVVVKVKAIDAQHCPGSVMYLFRGEFGCMLFTGDFRWESSGEKVEIGRAMLLDSLKNEPLDILYLDNFFCSPQYAFPPREVSAKQIVDIIASHPKHDIVIGIGSLGKEELLLHISRALNIKIWVWPERLKIMHLLGFAENFTTKTSLTRVRAVPRYSFSLETLQDLNKLRPTIGVMPSGLPWTENGKIVGSSESSLKKKDSGKETDSCSKMDDLGGNSASPTKFHDCIYVVPYSDHSCFSEIQEFVELLRPVQVKGIVSSPICCIDPDYYFDHLCGKEQAMWRAYQEVGNEGGMDGVEVAEIKSVAEVISTVEGRKRKIEEVDSSGKRVSRKKILRRMKNVGL